MMKMMMIMMTMMMTVMMMIVSQNFSSRFIKAQNFLCARKSSPQLGYFMSEQFHNMDSPVFKSL